MCSCVEGSFSWAAPGVGEAALRGFWNQPSRPRCWSACLPASGERTRRVWLAGDVFYMFVCRTLLGYSIRTTPVFTATNSLPSKQISRIRISKHSIDWNREPGLLVVERFWSKSRKADCLQAPLVAAISCILLHIPPGTRGETAGRMWTTKVAASGHPRNEARPHVEL